MLHIGELEGFLNSDGEREDTRPSSDDDEQYQLFLRNQLDFENWRNRQSKRDTLS